MTSKRGPKDGDTRVVTEWKGKPLAAPLTFYWSASLKTWVTIPE